jgi:hypothetical protein
MMSISLVAAGADQPEDEEQDRPTDHEQSVPRSDAAGVPDPIAELMGAQSFNIANHKVDDFRQAATKASAQRIVFNVGKPSGASQGMAVLTKKEANIRVNLVVRRSGKSTRFAAPTPEFVEPELREFLEPVHLVPVIDVTGAVPAGYLWPFRITAWDGYEKIFTTLAGLQDSHGVYVRYRRGAGDDPGGYDAEPFSLEPRHKAIWDDAKWPTAGDVLGLIAPVAFNDLLAENFNLKRAWAQVMQRRGQA